MPKLTEKKQLSAIVPSPQTNPLDTQIRQIDIGSQKLQPTAIPTVTSSPTQKNSNPWGVSKQIDEHTWTMQVGQDSTMATPQEILQALNTYRQRNGRNSLSWDAKLAEFAGTRATYFTSINKLDGHAGFSDYLHNQDGFHKLGFAAVGENSSIGYTLQGVHIIEWIYAGDKPHNDNQLSSQWQYVGIGVNGNATDLIFGGNKL